MKVQDALNTIIESSDMSARMAMAMFVLIKWNQAVWALLYSNGETITAITSPMN